MSSDNGTSKGNFAFIEADRMFFDADQKIKDGLVTEALELLYVITEKYPEYGRAYNHLGYLYETKYRDYYKAEHYYKKALEFDPHYPATYLNYSVLLSSSERFEELESLLVKALEVPGVNKDRIYNEFGIMYELQQRYDEAIDSFKKVIVRCLSDKNIDVYRKNIERCKLKRELLESL